MQLNLSPRSVPLRKSSPSLPQRVSASAAVSFKYKDSRTRLDRLYQQGSAKVRFPKHYNEPLEAVLINTAGGLTGGDALNWDLSLAEKAHVVATTQACEKAYRSANGTAHVTTSLHLKAHSALHWLPQETILYDGSSLARRFEVDLDQTATFLCLESLQLGREAMGETINQVTFHDRWRIKRNGRLLHADDLRLRGNLHSQATFGNNQALANLVFIRPQDEEQNTLLVEKLSRLCPSPLAGFSTFNGKITGRILAKNSYHLRQLLQPVLNEIRGDDLPRVWRI